MIAGAVAIGTGGCWFYAVEYAPIGMQVATGAASSALGAVERAVGHDPEQKGYCEALEAGAASVIQVRTGSGGNPEYRELQADTSAKEPRWAPRVSGQTDGDGWQPAVHFSEMDFNPPFADSVPKNGSRFLAYISSEPEATDNDERLLAFVRIFGKPTGSFKWGDRDYIYALPPTLPCFAPPS